MQVIGDKNQIAEDVFHFMISYLPFSHYDQLDAMINILIYLVWGCWVQLNSTHFFFFFADQIIFKNRYMKHAHS